MRVQKNGRPAIYMQCRPGAPGHDLADFIRIGNWLREIDLQTPEIYEADEKAGYAIIEDFGDTTFKKALLAGHDQRDLYTLAANVLEHISKQQCPLKLPEYFDSYVHKGHRRVIDWFVPALLQRSNPDGLVEEYLAAWTEIEQIIDFIPRAFLHVDFHVQNLMLLENKTGMRRCGILDFQGAMMGPVPYDLANLLEDARIMVPDKIRTEILDQYDRDFKNRYRVLATQFHCRVIGQFVKMAVRDNKTAYLDYIPVVAAYMQKALRNPLLRPLDRFFSSIGVDFGAINDLNVAQIGDHIRPDAI
jgi:N-acetylmuramate 1-kinase